MKTPICSPRRRGERLAQRLQLGELILRERLGRKEIQRAARRILQDRVEDRRVVAERLARRGRRDDDDVPAGERVLDRFGLMRVELIDAARPSACVSRASSASGNGAYCAATAGSRRTAVTCRSGVSGRSGSRPGARRLRSSAASSADCRATRGVVAVRHGEHRTSAQGAIKR